MSDWPTFLAIGALALSAFAFVSRSMEKSLSIREHDEYKSQEKEKAILRDKILELETKSVRAELDHLRRQIQILEQTRPTTEVLEARFNNLKNHT